MNGGILGQVTAGMQQLETANRMKGLVIAALTQEQQIGISQKVMGDINLLPPMLMSWLATPEGKAAVCELADKFIASGSKS